MAANEHKNLTDANRHNPKGFEIASNDTLCSKGTTGDLEWVDKSTIKISTFKMQGYATCQTNYEYRQNLTDGQSPYEMNQDYGSATVGAATLDVSDIFRTDAYIPHLAATVKYIRGWMSSSTNDTVTLAICKVTPADATTTALTPTVIDEIAIAMPGSPDANDKLKTINETTITAPSVAAGDLIFPMLKTSGSTPIVYFNVTIGLCYDN
tara:strand:+ start:3027 stop:3653 length:627 start_codon:yes stop_codon:yes gene_type:complete